MKSTQTLLFLFVLIACWLSATPAQAHGDLHDAIAGVSHAIAGAPGDASLFLRRAELHRLHRDFAAAEADYAKAAELQPNLAEVQFGLASLRLAQGRPQAALHLLDDFLAASSRHPEGYALRAELLEKQGAWKKADADLAAAVASSTEPHYATKRAQLLERHGEPEAAIRCLDEASRAHGRVPLLEQQALELEERAGKTEAVLHRLDDLIVREPRSDIWLARKARALASWGRAEDATLAWREAAAAFAKIPLEKRNLAINRELAAEIEANQVRLR